MIELEGGSSSRTEGVPEAGVSRAEKIVIDELLSSQRMTSAMDAFARKDGVEPLNGCRSVIERMLNVKLVQRKPLSKRVDTAHRSLDLCS